MQFLALTYLLALAFAIPPTKFATEIKHNAAPQGPKAISSFPTALKQQTLVHNMISKIDPASIKNYLVTLTQFPERYYTSQNGVKAANWLMQQVQNLQSQVSPDAVLTVKLFKHPKWIEPSVIARYEAKNSTGPGDILIAGTHFDTASHSGFFGGDLSRPNPAADDCASGASVIYESLRVLVSQQFIPKRPIEIHWYAAEEIGSGTLGSHEVAANYASNKVSVFSYLNLDQSGYVKAGTTPSIGFITDYTTKPATDFLRLTVKEYTTVTVTGDDACGYECTDNAAWYDSGYNSALAFEASSLSNATPYNDQVNDDGSALDTVDTVDFPHVQEFVKNTLGFLVELSLAP
ncbi:Leucine aminopeptidase 1 [Boothiomyces macroporosus]|uniref:Peptide hydrolase n=1 Tax=Boothiomyces macroporosus TaxID=261099 RepID=A0AAD5UF36_9FUNG|nr:Leucine aminopeptidase 1 [Boothiomyces macroporosus]